MHKTNLPLLTEVDVGRDVGTEIEPGFIGILAVQFSNYCDGTCKAMTGDD
jgi:hypothetical protein